MLISHKKLIVTAPPGTGKSTQIPQFFADRCSPEKKLIMLEPRRIAARSLAYRVADEMGCACGDEVGYQVRFERKSSDRTKIQFQTYGTFLQMLHGDPLAAGSSIVVFDEFHERSLEADASLAWISFLSRTVRPDLRIMVLSATIEPEPLRGYLGNAAWVDVPERSFPVSLRYQPSASVQEHLSRQVERAVRGMLDTGAEGSVLVFLPGASEIERAAEVLYEPCHRKGYALLTLHGRKPLAEQQEVLRLPSTRPCVILSTNVAETSLTVPGVTAVVDSGLARTAAYDPERGRNTLYLGRISLQNAKQRAGRAGRLAKGVCVRLWSREDERSMAETVLPEMLRLDLSKTMLALAAFSEKVRGGNKTIEFLTPPLEERWEKACSDLLRFNAIENYLSVNKSAIYNIESLRLTELGKAMSRLPLEPPVAAVLLQSRTTEERRLNKAMAAIWENGNETAAGSRDLFKLAGDFLNDSGRSGWGRDVQETVEQLDRLLDGTPCMPTGKKEDLRRSVSSVWMRTFGHRIAVKTADSSVYEFADKRCARLALKETAGGKPLLPQVILALVVHEQAGREQVKRTTIPLYLPLEVHWLEEIFPGELKRAVECRWDDAQKRVKVEETVKFRSIAIERRACENKHVYDEQIAACLVERLKQGIWEWRKDDPRAEQFVFRVRLAGRTYPEMRIPLMDESDWELVYSEISRGRSSLAEVRQVSVFQAIKEYIGGKNADFVEKKAPDMVILPSGRKGRVAYFDGTPPELSARITDFVGYRDRFMLMDGRVQGVFDILAPNYRTVQKTADLGSFWKNVYPSIKNGLKRKYPKHPWP
ncbi:MAG: hypothetical protein JW699_02295 [Chitinispirillaceae bacterium]|nr:hypothetical protein [Chitinispirillaceae bacterium]